MTGGFGGRDKTLSSCAASLLLWLKQWRGLHARSVHTKPRPFSLPLSSQPFSRGSDWRRIYPENLTKKSTSVPNKLECGYLTKRYLHSGPTFACALWVSALSPQLGNVRLWKLLLRFAETVFATSSFTALMSYDSEIWRTWDQRN